MGGANGAVKLLGLFRRRHLAHELLAQYDVEHLPFDPERFQRGLAKISAYAATHPVEPGAADRWAESVSRVLDRYPSG